MPFINDRLADTARRQAEETALVAENGGRAPPGPVAEPLLRPRFAIDPDAVGRQLRREVLGQEYAIRAVEDLLRVATAGIADPRRPLFTALFLGPTGVGKTELVRSLARSIHGDADTFCRVDMNTLSQSHYAAAITGAPPGYVGAREGRTILDQRLIEGSHERPGIVLFDELEKASPPVIDALLNVFDNGLLTVASGERTYSFRNALVFMTSNLGARDIQRAGERAGRLPHRLLPFPAAWCRRRLQRLMRRRLLQTFAPEFVNRIDSVSVFNWLDRDQARALVELELDRLNRRLASRDCRLALAPRVLERVAARGFDRRFGARSLRRAFRRDVEVPFARYLLAAGRESTLVAGLPLQCVGDLSGGELVFRQHSG